MNEIYTRTIPQYIGKGHKALSRSNSFMFAELNSMYQKLILIRCFLGNQEGKLNIVKNQSVKILKCYIRKYALSTGV